MMEFLSIAVEHIVTLIKFITSNVTVRFFSNWSFSIIAINYISEMVQLKVFLLCCFQYFRYLFCFSFPFSVFCFFKLKVLICTQINVKDLHSIDCSKRTQYKGLFVVFLNLPWIGENEKKIQSTQAQIDIKKRFFFVIIIVHDINILLSKFVGITLK